MILSQHSHADYTSQQILLGTSTSGTPQEELVLGDSAILISEVRLPKDDLPGDQKFDENRGGE